MEWSEDYQRFDGSRVIWSTLVGVGECVEERVIILEGVLESVLEDVLKVLIGTIRRVLIDYLIG